MKAAGARGGRAKRRRPGLAGSTQRGAVPSEETGPLTGCIKMGTELTLSYADATALSSDYESNLRKGRAFVPGAWGLTEREYITLRIEHPSGGAPLCLEAEAVWINEDRASGGTGVAFLSFDDALRDALKAFVGPLSPSPTLSGEMPAPESVDAAAALHLHDRIRGLSITEREVVARQGSLPERVALERRFGGSVWEGMLHNPQLTSREVLRMAKSASLPINLVNLIVANKAWLADAAIQAALLSNPRVSGAHLERVLRSLPQAELIRLSEQSSLRMQVRQGAKRLIRR